MEPSQRIYSLKFLRTLVIALALSLLFIDQLIKIYVKTHFLPGEVVPVFTWFQLTYTENQGMAFGIEPFGSAALGKMLLSGLRLVLIVLGFFYLRKLIIKRQGLLLIVCITLIWSGAMGNMLDSMLYDYIFGFSAYFPDRQYGFLLGSVVDMFQFNIYYPDWMPEIGGRDIFPAIFNFADACITVGIAMIFIFDRAVVETKPKK